MIFLDIKTIKKFTIFECFALISINFFILIFVTSKEWECTIKIYASLDCWSVRNVKKVAFVFVSSRISHILLTSFSMADGRVFHNLGLL